MGSFVPVLQNSATFLLIAASKIAVLPVLALALPPTEFGVYALIAAGLSFGVVAIGLNVNAYASRSIPGMNAVDARRLVGTTALVEAGFGAAVLGGAILTGAGSAILEILNVREYAYAFVLAGVWLVIDLYNLNLRSYLFARREVTRANLLDLLRLVGWIPLVLLYWSLRGLLSVDVLLVASVAGSAVGAAFGIVAIRPITSGRINLTLVGKALRFSIPLITPGVTLAAMRVADRSVLSAQRSLEEVAAYGLATGLAAGIYSFTALSVETVLLPVAVRSMNDRDASAANAVIMAILAYSVWTFSAVALALWLVMPVFGALLSRAYTSGLASFPLIAFGYLALAVSRAPHNALFLQNRTRAMLSCDTITIIVAVLLDLALIPMLGITGAALASLIAFTLNVAAKVAFSGLWRQFQWHALVRPRWGHVGSDVVPNPPPPE